MSIGIEEFHQQLSHDVQAKADVDGQYIEDAFFEIAGDYLAEAGEIETADRAAYIHPKGFRLDGYGGDPLTTDNVLSLIIMNYSQSLEMATLDKTELNAMFKRVANFLNLSLKDEFRDTLDESSQGFGVADLIASRWRSGDVAKVRLFAVTNRELRTTIDSIPAGNLQGIPVTYNVWDLSRLYHVATAGHGRENISINLANDFGGSLPALPAHLDNADYESYLVVVPGDRLAAIYDRWGSRLLEQNVRVFLQARGNVNKGIRNTLENQPEMFFAYNNGITATAENVETVLTDEGLQITAIENLQIVNGGQTTASIHAAWRKKPAVDVSRVFVQMKLSVIDPSRMLEVVPAISQFANTQNRIAAADFFSNHPFHVRMENISRRLFAPAPDGTFRETKWFYERARGQYLDERAKLTLGQQKRFMIEYPRQQLFSKTDLAKFLNVWKGKPDLVSKGAQKNFAEFARQVSDSWEKQETQFNEQFYRQAIAKAIIFKHLEKVIPKQSWYDGGYRANVVAYAIAKLAHDVQQRGMAVDFDQVWRRQAVPEPLAEALLASASAVRNVIVNPAEGRQNVTEWAKQPACWSRVKALQVSWPDAWLQTLVFPGDVARAEKSAERDQKMVNGIVAQTAVVNAGATTWESILSWGDERQLLSPKERGILSIATAMPSKIPTEKQSQAALAILGRLHEEGCRIGLEIPPVA